MAKNVAVMVGDNLENFQGVEIARFNKTGGGTVEFAENPTPSTGTGEGNIFTVTFYSPDTITDNQKAEIAALFNEILSASEDFSIVMNIGGNLVPAALVLDSRYKNIVATQHGTSSYIYTISLSSAGAVSTAQEWLYLSTYTDTFGSSAKAPTANVVAQFVADYVEQYGGASDEQIASALEAYLAENPIKGDKGDPGETGPQGPAGEDGVSPTVSFVKHDNGYDMTVTDVNGSKVISIENGEKGEKGDTGEQGIQGVKGDTGADGAKGDKGDTGEKGADGTSVTVSKVTESTADGGSNVVTFSDGKTLTVKNGSKGSTGATGEKGEKGDTGAAGADGKDGESGVYVGSGEAPEGTKVQVDPEAEGELVIPEVKQKTGNSTEDTMSQKAITELFGIGTVPDYWISELETKADAIQTAMEKAGKNKSAFLWYTDAHWANGNSKVSPKLLNYLYMNTPMNKVNFGGDIIGDTLLATREEMKYLYEWRKAIKDLPNHHSVLGNHDMFSLDTVDYEDDNYRYAFMIAPEESPDMVMGDGCYYYIDNPCEKTRYLYLAYMTSDHTAMMAQGQFFVDAIKSVPEGWHIVAIAHRWWQYSSSSTPTTGSIPAYEAEILSVFDAYNARGTRDGSNYFYAQDFSDAKGKIEFCICGHIHLDFDFETEGGIPVIVTTADANQDRVPDSTVDSGTVGTTTEAAVFGIIADYNDTNNTKITVVGVGRGTSRVVGTAAPVANLLNLNRTYVAGTTDENLRDYLDESKAYTNVGYSAGSFNAKACTVSDITENSVTIKESGVGGVTVAYALYLPDITKDAYRLTFDYSGTGKCRTYYRYGIDGVFSGVNALYGDETSGSSGSADVTIPANTDGYTWLIIMFGSNTSGTKSYSNVTLTKA